MQYFINVLCKIALLYYVLSGSGGFETLVYSRGLYCYACYNINLYGIMLQDKHYVCAYHYTEDGHVVSV